MENPLFKFIQSTFRLPAKDARTLFWLFFLIVILLAYPLYLQIFEIKTSPAEGQKSGITADFQKPSKETKEKLADSITNKPTSLFHFNPNTLSKDSLALLGIPKGTISWLIRMRGLNKQLKTTSDFYALYGVNDSLFAVLKPYILLPEQVENNDRTKPSQSNSGGYTNKAKPNYPTIEKPKLYTFNLNTCDSSALVQLPYIGNAMAQRIIYHRDRLGGFHSLEQLYEVYLLDSLPVQWIKTWATETNFNAIRKIDINTCAIGTLREHPYIGWKKADVLIKYRLNHGPFCSLRDLAKTRLFTPEDISKLAPYLHLHTTLSE